MSGIPRADGLDLTTLRALRRPRPNLTAIKERIEEHLDNHDGYLAFSGGKDSLVALHLTRAVEPNIPVVFFDSWLEYPQTYEYIADLADAWNLNLEVHRADPPLLTVLADSGEWDHHLPTRATTRALRDILIGAPSRAAHQAHGPGEIWGVRADESAKGTGRWSMYYNALNVRVTEECTDCCTTAAQQRQTHGGALDRADGTHVFGPAWNLSSEDIWTHIAAHDLPVNPVYDKLRRLGTPEQHLRVSHILDGAFLERGRITRLRRGWPALFEELARVLPRIREFV
ncbi:phosphoadenosine phosphosulfate reductase family protein [Rhodococcus cerastii]|nr:phosphoadenosine phosphosulfate reductase family protein [Rhodococcus cerastii]